MFIGHNAAAVIFLIKFEEVKVANIFKMVVKAQSQPV